MLASRQPQVTELEQIANMLEELFGLPESAQTVRKVAKLIDAADYLQHCRRSEALTYRERDNVLRIKRASDHYDFLRDKVKL